MYRRIEYKITCEDEGTSVEKYLRGKGYTRQSIIELKKYKNSTMIGETWVHMNYKLCKDDVLVVAFDEAATSEKIPPVKLTFPVIYEDEDIVVVNKPADMPIHPSLNNYENTLGNAAAYYYEEKGENFVFRCINRLDRDTTGLTILAKHFVAAGILYDQMKKRDIHREYVAIVEGSDISDEGIVDAPIGRVKGSTIERCIDFENGERAVTHYKVLKRKETNALLAFRLETGRTHQIRVHMKHIGHPLLGDWLYNPENKEMARQALHSRSLDFAHPISGEEMHFECELPEDMRSIGYCID